MGFVDLAGRKIGLLTVIAPVGVNRWGSKKWLCRCDCGKTKVIVSGSLVRETTKSCGCLSDENLRKRWENMKKSNDFYIQESIAYVKLGGTNNVMICDSSDWEKFKAYFWHEDNMGYARTACKKCRSRFHQLVLSYSNPMVADHINRNKLDNRKENLRIVSHSINSLNSERSEKSTASTNRMRGVY